MGRAWAGLGLGRPGPRPRHGPWAARGAGRFSRAGAGTSGDSVASRPVPDCLGRPAGVRRGRLVRRQECGALVRAGRGRDGRPWRASRRWSAEEARGWADACAAPSPDWFGADGKQVTAARVCSRRGYRQPRKWASAAARSQHTDSFAVPAGGPSRSKPSRCADEPGMMRRLWFGRKGGAGGGWGGLGSAPADGPRRRGRRRSIRRPLDGQPSGPC